MTYDLSAPNLVGLAAGVLILGIGTFVLIAKPDSALHRLFFGLALMDGVSTILFRLFVMTDDPLGRVYFLGVYFYHFIAFLVVLAIFGLMFPRPATLHRWATITLVATPIVIGAVFLGLYALRHDLFWESVPGPFFSARVLPLGNLLNVIFAVLPAIFVLRLSRSVTRETSPTHRNQAVFVLGGLALAYLPYPTTNFIQTLATDPSAFITGRWDQLLAYWSFALVTLVLIISSIRLIRLGRREGYSAHAVAYGCYGGVGIITLFALLVPTPLVGALLRSTALLAYPVLLGYAISRYEVFDIDSKLRRAATVTLVAGTLTASFVVVETAVENLLQDTLFGSLNSTLVSSVLATVTTAAITLPVAKLSRKLTGRILPELKVDEMTRRKLEIYEHSLAGALQDGWIAEHENRTLSRLRESLGISLTDHEELVARILARQAPQGTPRAAPA